LLLWVATVTSIVEERLTGPAVENLALAPHERGNMLQALADAAFEGVLIHRDGIIHAGNRAAEELGGVGPGGLVGRPLLDFIAPESHTDVLQRIAANDDRPYEVVARRVDGTKYILEIQVRTVTLETPGGSLRVVALRDLSARRALEARHREAEKMEAIGRLAGGVAHDFNNLLCVILAATEAAHESLPENHEARAGLADAHDAAERAAELTRQLLAFGRKQVLTPRVVDLNTLLETSSSMLRRVVPESIDLVILPAPVPVPVLADLGQLELMLLNLALNARDAIGSDGRLTLEAQLVVLDEEDIRTRPDLRPGPHALLTVSDTGAGMDSATSARVFEPFFTTKTQGQGSGLGLAMVFGTVKQSGGDVWVRSAPGKGSSFVICLPTATLAAASSPETAGAPRAVTSSRTILVVDDEPMVRRVVVTVLRRAGYEVFEASGPTDAKAISRSLEETIDLLVSDVVMPVSSGRQLAETLTAERPGLRVVLMSGYTPDGIGKDGAVDDGMHFLPKPFSADALLETVRSALAN
jgi:two-component system, cell cycle sensor histidine kinase and response regulator CckA